MPRTSASFRMLFLNPKLRHQLCQACMRQKGLTKSVCWSYNLRGRISENASQRLNALCSLVPTSIMFNSHSSMQEYVEDDLPLPSFQEVFSLIIANSSTNPKYLNNILLNKKRTRNMMQDPRLGKRLREEVNDESTG